MSHAHDNLSVAVGAAKEQARVLLFESRRGGTAPSDRCMSVYLALIVMHRELQAADPPSIDRFIPELKQGILECDGQLGVVKALLEAALRATSTRRRRQPRHASLRRWWCSSAGACTTQAPWPAVAPPRPFRRLGSDRCRGARGVRSPRRASAETLPVARLLVFLFLVPLRGKKEFDRLELLLRS